MDIIQVQPKVPGLVLTYAQFHAITWMFGKKKAIRKKLTPSRMSEESQFRRAKLPPSPIFSMTGDEYSIEYRRYDLVWPRGILIKPRDGGRSSKCWMFCFLSIFMQLRWAEQKIYGEPAENAYSRISKDNEDKLVSTSNTDNQK